MGKPAKFKIKVYRGGGKQERWYWSLMANNGKTVADGSEGYASYSNAVRAVRNVQAKFAKAEIVKGLG